MKRIYLIGLLLALLTGIFTIPASADETPAVPANAVIIDVRTEAEWKEGHLEGAVLIPHERIVEGITAVAPDKKGKIYLYCRSGRRTGIAFDALKQTGYENLVNLGTMQNASKILKRPIVKP